MVSPLFTLIFSTCISFLSLTDNGKHACMFLLSPFKFFHSLHRLAIFWSHMDPMTHCVKFSLHYSSTLAYSPLFLPYDSNPATNICYNCILMILGVSFKLSGPHLCWHCADPPCEAHIFSENSYSQARQPSAPDVFLW